MRILCCDGRTTRFTVITALVFFVTFYFLSISDLTFFKQSFSNVPKLDSWAHIEVVEPEEPLWPYRAFKSSPWRPPNITITRHRGELADGYLLLTAKSRGYPQLEQSAPWIFTEEGDLVYAYNGSHGSNNLRMQQYEGKPHLTVWLGESTIGHGYGELAILDEEYRQINVTFKPETKMKMSKGRDVPGLIDFHEQELSSRGTVYVTAYNNTPADLTAIGGRQDGWLANSIIYEIDIKTGDVLFTWSALDHIPLEASHLELQTYMGSGISGSPWDHFHLNSIEEVGDHLLINSRHTFSLYLVDRKTGEIEWEMSGRGEGGDFGALGEEGQFSWQHHAQAHNVTTDGMTISLFDNHHMPELNKTTSSRGLLLHASLPPDPAKPPTLLRDIHADEAIHSGSQGSYIPALSNGNQLMCYGPTPVVREFGPEGELRWEGRFGNDDRAQSYRAFKEIWRATPRDWDPSLYVEMVDGGKKRDGDKDGDEELELHVSWNGATEVEDWNVYTKKKGGGKWTKAGKAKRMGFETVLRVEGGKDVCVLVGAVEGGKEVRRSNEVCL